MIESSDPYDTGGAAPEEPTSSTESDTGEGSTQAEETKSDQRGHRRSRSRTQFTALKKQMDALMQKVEGLESSSTQSSSQTQREEQSPRPKEDDFDDVEAFHKADEAWKNQDIISQAKKLAQQEVKEKLSEAQAKWEQASAKQQVETQFNDDLNALRNETDFEEIKAVLNPDDPDEPFMTIGVYRAIRAVSNRLDVLAAVGRRPELLDGLLEAMSRGPAELGIEVGRLSQKIGGTKRSTRAPAPTGSYSTGIPSNDKDPVSAFVKAREKDGERVEEVISPDSWAKMGAPLN